MTGNSAAKSASRSGHCFSSFFFFSPGETRTDTKASCFFGFSKAEKTGCFRRIPAELRATFWCSGSTVFHFIAFVTKNSRLYFEEAGRLEQQLVIQLLLSRLPGLFQIYKTTNLSRAARSVNQSTNVFHHASHTPANTHYKLIACVARRVLLGAK